MSGAPEGLGTVRGVGGVRGALGADRECRYTGDSMGIGGVRGFLGNVGLSGAIRGLGL